MLENEDFLKILEHAFAIAQETVHTIQDKNNSGLSKAESLNADLAIQQETSLKQFDECAKRTKLLNVEIEEKQQMIDALISDKEQLKNSCEVQASLNSELQDELKTDIDHQKDRLAKSEIARNQSIEEISGAQKIIDVCDKYFGLQILALKEKRMQFLFKNIIPEKPDTVAFINISLNDHKDYRIVETYPALPELKKLEEALNRTSNFSGFIQCSRKLLKNELLKSI